MGGVAIEIVLIVVPAPFTHALYNLGKAEGGRNLGQTEITRRGGWPRRATVLGTISLRGYGPWLQTIPSVRPQHPPMLCGAGGSQGSLRQSPYQTAAVRQEAG